MKALLPTPTSKLLVGLQNIKNTNYLSYVLAQILLISSTLSGIFFHGLTVLVGLGLLIVEASTPHSGMDYTGLLYKLAASEFTNSF